MNAAVQKDCCIDGKKDVKERVIRVGIGGRNDEAAGGPGRAETKKIVSKIGQPI